MSEILGPDGKPLKMRTCAATSAVREEAPDIDAMLDRVNGLAQYVERIDDKLLAHSGRAMSDLSGRGATGGWEEICAAVVYAVAETLFRDTVNRRCYEEALKKFSIDY